MYREMPLFINVLRAHVLVSFNRYMSICHNERAKVWFTRRNCVIICIVLWLVSFVFFTLPTHIGFGDMRYDVKGMICMIDRTHFDFLQGRRHAANGDVTINKGRARPGVRAGRPRPPSAT